MLTLTRKPGEEIVIPELDITIRITEVLGNRVSVSIDAPKDLTILRRELIKKTRRNSQPAPDVRDVISNVITSYSPPESPDHAYQAAPIVSNKQPSPIVRMKLKGTNQ